jgi:glutamate racemase
VESGIYASVSERLYPHDHLKYQAVIGSWLVDSIEAGASDKEILKALDPLMQQFHPDIEAILLGCTHYPLITKQIQQWMDLHFSVQIPLIDPSREAAHQFVWYVKRHPEIATTLQQKSSWWTVTYCVTGDPKVYDERIFSLFGKEVKCEGVKI